MADEPEKPKFDRFKPSVPKIPGVPDPDAPVAAAPAAAAPAGIPKQYLMMGGGAAGLLLLVLIIWFATRTEPPPVAPSAAATPAATDPASPAATTAASPAGSLAAVPVAPGEIGTVQEFAKPWSSKRFIFRKFTDEVAGMAVRLPTGSARSPSGYWAFSLGRPKDRCELQFISDLKVLASDYGFPATHPMVVDPCNRSVFDPMKLGDIGGSWVRGDVVKGSAYRPPLSILLRIQGNSVSAVQME